jgi:flagellar biosynthesis protein FliR
MPIEVHFGASYLAGFLLTIVRVGSALFMLPLPGFKDAQKSVRIVLIVSITFCLFPSWPVLTSQETSGAQFALAALAEVAAGLLIVCFYHGSHQQSGYGGFPVSYAADNRTAVLYFWRVSLSAAAIGPVV